MTGPQFWDTRNPTEHPDLVTLDMLEQTYLVPTQNVGARLPMQRHGWHEYGNYIGPVSAILLDLGLLFVLVRRAPAHHWFGVSLAVTSLFLFLLSLGEFGAWAPASLAHYVPLFSSFRIPSRYTIPLLQFAALTLGWAFQSIVTRYGFPRGARIAVGVIALAASAHLIVVNQWNLKNVFTEPPFDTAFHWNSGPHQITTDTESNAYAKGSPMLRALMQDRSFYNCYESLQVPRGAGPGSPVLDANPSARVSDVDFTPNRLTFTVNDGRDPARVLLNQNWAAGWTSTAGEITVSKPTELSFVTVPPGTTGRFTFTFVPPGFYAGTLVFVVALIATALLWRRRLRPIFSAQPPR